MSPQLYLALPSEPSSPTAQREVPGPVSIDVEDVHEALAMLFSQDKGMSLAGSNMIQSYMHMEGWG